MTKMQVTGIDNDLIGAQNIPMTKTELPEITNKVMRGTFRHMSDPGGATRKECWAADTVDGIWHFERVEDVGTPWIVVHIPTNTEIAMYYNTLKSARTAVARGWTQKEVDRRTA